MSAKILIGDNRAKLLELPEKHFHCAITSPPYFGLRSYLPKDSPLKKLEIGREKTPAEFTAASGYKKWSDNDLAAMANKIETTVAV